MVHESSDQYGQDSSNARGGSIPSSVNGDDQRNVKRKMDNEDVERVGQSGMRSVRRKRDDEVVTPEAVSVPPLARVAAPEINKVFCAIAEKWASAAKKEEEALKLEISQLVQVNASLRRELELGHAKALQLDQRFEALQTEEREEEGSKGNQKKLAQEIECLCRQGVKLAQETCHPNDS